VRAVNSSPGLCQAEGRQADFVVVEASDSAARSSVVTTTERIFVIRNKDGRAEWVDVRKGTADGDLVEVLGDLKGGDMIVRRANDEIREGTPLQIQPKR